MIRTHIRIAHVANIRTGSPVDSRQCDCGISYNNYIGYHGPTIWTLIPRV